MMCPHMEAKLNEHVDGAQAAPDRASLEAHLSGCAGCRAAIAELRSLSASAASLPRSIEPGRDLIGFDDHRIGVFIKLFVVEQLPQRPIAIAELLVDLVRDAVQLGDGLGNLVVQSRVID